MTDDGVELAQKLMGIGNLYDPINLESLHILNQCLRAHSLYKRDVNYLVADDGKVLIIDEFTGRVLAGRRWSDGLHQAVEAKENVRIQEETRTMATITFQNLFRLYKKLSGMTGTADTEATEFHETYKLERHRDIPTNKPMIREDHEDVVYKTEREKFTAVIAEILECHEKGQPVLVGTTSVEKSNAIAQLLKKKKIPHAVLNAKHHEREAYVVAQAGRKRRHHGQHQHGRPRHRHRARRQPRDDREARVPRGRARSRRRARARSPSSSRSTTQACKAEGEEVRELGGLHILGTERHESRRIDNQLRGRAGRQGDPGSSRFYLSLEDDLMRIFAGDRVKSLMERMGMPDNEPIVHPWVTRSIQDAQRKVEERNFDMRKHLLEYDDVMNEQRKTVYKLRQQLLLGIYTPEKLDDDGKPTGKMREIKVAAHASPSEVKQRRRQMTSDRCTHGTPIMAPATARHHAPRRRRKVDEVEARFYSMASLQQDVYQFWGYRFDFRDGDGKKPQGGLRAAARANSRRASPSSASSCSTCSTASSARSSRSAARRTSRPRTGTGRASRAASSSTSATKPPDVEHLHDAEQIAQGAVRRGRGEARRARRRRSGTELLLRVFRHFYLEEIDRQWVEHLTNMEHLRDGIGLRGYGQRDPKQEYKKEGYDVFVTMMASTCSNVCSKLFKAQVKRENENRAHRARGRREARGAGARDADAARSGGSGRRRRGSGAALTARPQPARVSRGARAA